MELEGGAEFLGPTLAPAAPGVGNPPFGGCVRAPRVTVGCQHPEKLLKGEMRDLVGKRVLGFSLDSVSGGRKGELGCPESTLR